jgi:hypothetical protein
MIGDAVTIIGNGWYAYHPILKSWELSKPAKIAICIPIIGIFVGIKACISLKNRITLINLNANLDEEQKTTNSQAKTVLRNAFKSCLRAGIVNHVLSIAVVIYLLAIQAIPVLLGQVLITGFVLTLLILAYILNSDKIKYIIKKITSPTPDLEQFKAAIADYTALCREQENDFIEINQSIAHLSNECNLLISTGSSNLNKCNGENFGKEMSVQVCSLDVDDKELKRKEDKQKFLAELTHKASNYPILSENPRDFTVAHVRETITARMEHHAEIKAAIHAELQEQRDDVNESSGKIEKLLKNIEQLQEK